MTIGEHVLELIREAGMTQKTFSQRTGIPQSTISDWGGKKLNPSSDKIAIICDVLNIDPSYLLTGNSGKKYERTQFLYVDKESEEYELIVEYRELDRDSRNRLLGYAKALSELREKKARK